MKQIYFIAKKELLNYLSQPVGYVFAGLLTVVANWIFLSDLFVGGLSSLTPLFFIIVFLFSLFIPAIAMGLIADEKKNGNWELILSLPVSEAQMVLGKFLGASLFLLITELLFLPTVIAMYLIGRPETGLVISGFLGILLIGLAYLATGVLASSMTNSAVIAFLTTTVFLLINNFMGQGVLVDRLPLGIRNVVLYLSLASKTRNMGTGLVETSEIIFFISWVVINLLLAVMVLKGRDK